ncbi:hypothetical protein V6X63_10545 [Spiribacter sp. 221]|uniref:hypothetical protein n=1 Tax=Spiribacter onubensis TaxID=3122420 RepID=UPI00349FADB7
MENARDSCDTLLDNGHIGWFYKEDKQASLSPSFLRVYEEWEHRDDGELEAFVLAPQRGISFTVEQNAASPEARTEGGQKVFVSVRRELDASLREQALAIHGLTCVACASISRGHTGTPAIAFQRFST